MERDFRQRKPPIRGFQRAAENVKVAGQTTRGFSHSHSKYVLILKKISITHQIKANGSCSF